MAWDTSLRGSVEHRTNHQIAKLIYDLFCCKNTKLGIKYTLGGAYVSSTFGKVSKKALALIRKNAREQKKGWTKNCFCDEGVLYTEFPKSRKPDKNGRMVIDKEQSVTIEHTIPVEALYEELNRRHANGSLTVEYIERLLPKMYVALIRDDENDKLVRARLNSRMPDGWWDTRDLDPMERYRSAGLGDIWVK